MKSLCQTKHPQFLTKLKLFKYFVWSTTLKIYEVFNLILLPFYSTILFLDIRIYLFLLFVFILNMIFNRL